MSDKIPILIFSDAVSAPTGLGRITRDIASRLVLTMGDQFDVATIGYGGSTSVKFPWHQYSWPMTPDWIIHDLPEVWLDFAGQRKGIFMSVQDPGRMIWLARPETCEDEAVAKFLRRKPFKKWGYFPIDATGPNDKLSCMLAQCLFGYDRILTYSKWAEKIVINTLGMSAAEDAQIWNLPHGIDTKLFHPHGKKFRQMFGTLAQLPRAGSIEPDEFLIGIVATNQLRKDFGLALGICAEIAKQRKTRIWIHTDHLDRHWAIPYLFKDFNIPGENIVSTGLIDDESMAKLYSCCDVTLGIGLGEGFGYPIFESLACGVPCVHGNYGGAPEYMPRELLIEPSAFRLEGVYGSVRPCFSTSEWICTINSQVNGKKEWFLHGDLRWENLWPRWESWFRKGVQNDL